LLQVSSTLVGGKLWRTISIWFRTRTKLPDYPHAEKQGLSIFFPSEKSLCSFIHDVNWLNQY